MILQNIIFPTGNIDEKEIYIRNSNRVNQKNGSENVSQNEEISTDTYMNAFDIVSFSGFSTDGRGGSILPVSGRN